MTGQDRTTSSTPLVTCLPMGSEVVPKLARSHDTRDAAFLQGDRGMTRRVRCLAIQTAYLAILLAVASCAAPTKRLAPETAKKLHKLALLDVPEPQKYGATNLYLEGVFLGGVVNMQHSDQLTQAMHEKGFSVSQPFTECLARKLRDAGFEVERMQVTRKPSRPGFELQGKTDADALLNVGIGAGYVSAHGVDDYIPSVGARAELLENRTGQQSQIYMERYWYGYTSSSAEGIKIDASPTYRYGSFDALLQSSAQAGEGLREGALLICERLVTEVTAKSK